MNLFDDLPLDVGLRILDYLDTDDYYTVARMYNINPVREVCRRLKNEKWATISHPVKGNKGDSATIKLSSTNKEFAFRIKYRGRHEYPSYTWIRNKWIITKEWVGDDKEIRMKWRYDGRLKDYQPVKWGLVNRTS
ncbi:hypothetical protein DFS34DRAFT_595913 [Phlyctochytrium arcticum]|nr:hypothetical protein DFS34DRAFT_595913 [Phlyctochytrium arcticum]